MTTVEIIHLRFSGSGAEPLLELVGDTTGETEGVEVHVYHRTGISTDLAVHIIRKTDREPRGPSALGAHLASLLGWHGLVDHSIWIEATKDRNNPCSPS